VEFTPLAQEKGLNLKFAPCSLAVQSDRRLLRRLLQNLVSNAIKYTPKGRVLVGCRRHGGRLRIDVYDTGLGVPASKKRAIFQEFHRLDQGAKVARGLGLGLSIVERIARVLDHKIIVSSAVARGSQFSVEVPLSALVPPRQQQHLSPDVDRVQLSGITVLCIDNDLAILEGMEMLLEGWGCRVLKAPDLAAAIARVAETKVAPDGLLVDYHLDDGNGIAAIAELRRRFGADLTAILITADRSRQQDPGAQQARQASGIARVVDAMAHAAACRGGMRVAQVPGSRRGQAINGPRRPAAAIGRAQFWTRQ